MANSLLEEGFIVDDDNFGSEHSFDENWDHRNNIEKFRSVNRKKLQQVRNAMLQVNNVEIVMTFETEEYSAVILGGYKEEYMLANKSLEGCAFPLNRFKD